MWSIATDYAGKKEGKKKNKELDAQTNLPETGIEFLHIHYFCCPLRMTETGSGDKTKTIYELYERPEDFWLSYLAESEIWIWYLSY